MLAFLTVVALAQPSLGYPIIVRSEKGRCTYQIQDMLDLRVRDVRHWMRELKYKDRQIDIVWFERADRSCVAKAKKLARSGGFSKILERNGNGLEYPSGLPPE